MTKKKTRMKKMMEKLKGIKLQRGQKILVIFVAAFVLAALVFAIVFGAIMSARRAMAAVRYESVNIDEKTAAYLISYYKYWYMGNLRAQRIPDVEDTMEFWGTSDENGIEYGQILMIDTLNFLRRIAVSNHVFNQYGKLTDADRKSISDKVDAMFNSLGDDADEALAASGTDRASVRRAAELIYKDSLAQKTLCGEDGSKLLAYESEVLDLEKYLQEYSRVKILVIGKEDATESELAERAELIGRIDEEIRRYESKEDGRMTEELFESYIKNNSDGDKSRAEGGYYFSAFSEYTESIIKSDTVFKNGDGKEIVETALNMKNESYEKIEIDFATIYLYKCQVEPEAYGALANKDFFGDFYSDAADYLFPLLLHDLFDDVEFTERLAELPIIGASCEHYKLYSKKFVGSGSSQDAFLP